MSTRRRSLRRCGSSTADSTAHELSIQHLRSRLLLERAGKYREEDIQRIREEDWWLQIFLTSADFDPDIAYAILLECLRWRKAFDVERISLLELKPLLERQLVYIHGKTKDGIPLLWINMASYFAGEPNFDKLLVFWMERQFMETRGGVLTILIDMTGTGLKNMDFDIFKFLLHAIKYYYPGTVADILVYESPPILNASWKIIRSWLDANTATITQVTRISLPEYVDRDFLQPSQGGTDTFQFSMDELAKCLPTGDFSDKENGFHTPNILDRPGSVVLDSFPVKRSVKFDYDEDANRDSPLMLTSRRSSKGPGSRKPLPPAFRPVVERRNSAPETEWLKSSFVAITPKEELLLSRIDGETDLVDVVALKNMSNANVMFKIKTTSPEKFRVRPSNGIIAGGATESVRVYLQNEYRCSCSREKFLLMALETNSTNIDQFAELWKSAPIEAKMEQKLKCKVQPGATDDNDDRPERKSSLLSHQQEQIKQLRDQIDTLTNTQHTMTIVIALLFVMLVVAVLYDRSNNQTLKTIMEMINEERREHNSEL